MKLPDQLDHLEECAVIGGTLLWPDPTPYPPTLELLEPEHFTDKAHSQIWMAIDELRGSGAGIDEVGVATILRGWDQRDLIPYVFELATQTPTSTNLDHWASLVYEVGRKRLLGQKLEDVRERAAKGESVDEIAAGVLDAFRQVERLCDDRGLVHVREPVQVAVAQLEHEAANPEESVCIRSGLTDLDRMVRFLEGDLTIIAGRPSMGKTALAGCIAANVSQDITRGAVALFSLEMDATSLVTRFMQRAAGAGYDRLLEMARHGELAAVADKLWRLDLYIDDRANIDVDELRRALRKLHKVRLVVVDYLQLAKLGDGNERHDLKVGAVTKGLKAVAKDFGCHVIALSQLARRVEQRNDKRPLMSDLRDSGNIEEDADNILLLFRKEYYFPQEDGVKGRAEIIISKQRKGSTGSVEVAWRDSAQSFDDLARD